jgi:hypothetical protein
MPTEEQEKVQPTAIDIFDQSLATEEVDINPEANAFAFPPPPPESGNPYRVKIKRGQKGWMSYPGKNGKPGYLATDIEARIIAPGVEGVDDRPLFDGFASTMVMQSSHTSRVAGILKAIYDTRGQGETLPSHTSHLELSRKLQEEFDKESEVGVWIQWTAYCEACSDDKKRVEVKGEKRFPMNAEKTGHLAEMEHGQCGSTISAQAKVTRYVALT